MYPCAVLNIILHKITSEEIADFFHSAILQSREPLARIKPHSSSARQVVISKIKDYNRMKGRVLEYRDRRLSKDYRITR